MLIRIVGTDLPGRACAASEGLPGYQNIHVGVQRRSRPTELLDLTPGDAPTVSWEFDCEVVDTRDGVDLKGPYVSGRPHERFVYLSWGTVADDGTFTVFRRAKLWLSGLPEELVAAGRTAGALEGRLGLTDACGNPLCASVRPPRINWVVSAADS